MRYFDSKNRGNAFARNCTVRTSRQKSCNQRVGMVVCNRWDVSSSEPIIKVWPYVVINQSLSQRYWLGKTILLIGNTLKAGGEPSTPNLLHSSVTSPYKCQSSIININQIKPSKNSKDNRMIDKNQQESNVSRERTNEINKRSEKSISR